VLVSCKAADLRILRRLGTNGATASGVAAEGGESGQRRVLAEELRETPVGDQAAVQAVLSQLACDELLQGLDGAALLAFGRCVEFEARKSSHHNLHDFGSSQRISSKSCHAHRSAFHHSAIDLVCSGCS
jgi:hypothetical protein